MDDIKINDIIEVVVTGIQKYGAFVLINDKYDGLIHISKVSKSFVKDINDFLHVGDIIKCYVDDIDKTREKVQLTLIK